MQEHGCKLEQVRLWDMVKAGLKSAIADSVGNIKGVPAKLIRKIESGEIKPVSAEAQKETVWRRSIPRWEYWCRDIISKEPKPVDFLCYNNHRLERRRVMIPDLGDIVRFEYVDNFECDIKEVYGIAASKSSDVGYKSIRDFSENGCAKFLPDGFDKNIKWDEIRLHNMRFEYVAWGKGNYYWLNSGGSHHFAAAWKNAHDERREYVLSGKLTRLEVDTLAVYSFCQQWDMYVMDEVTAYCEFYDSMIGFGCSFSLLPVPRWLFGSAYIPSLEESLSVYDIEEKLKVVLLRRDCRKQVAVSKVLHEAGFINFKPHVLELAKR